MPTRRPAAAARDPQHTRARILAAAKAEFARGGLGGARVDRIAALAGANKRMLYYYYDNKDGLFRSFEWTGKGQYELRAHLMAGDLKLDR